MVKHLVLFRWKAAVPEARIARARARVESLRGKIDGVIGVGWATNTARHSRGYSDCLVVELEDEAALARWLADRRHRRIADEEVLPLVAEHVVLDIDAAALEPSATKVASR